MVYPKLIHPVPVIVEQIDREETLYDDDARAPMRVAKRNSQVTLQGQVKWGVEDEAEATRTGDTLDSDGYVLFETKALSEIGFIFNIGDRIISIGGVSEEVYVVKFKPMGHYPDIGGPGLLRVDFTARKEG